MAAFIPKPFFQSSIGVRWAVQPPVIHLGVSASRNAIPIATTRGVPTPRQRVYGFHGRELLRGQRQLQPVQHRRLDASRSDTRDHQFDYISSLRNRLQQQGLPIMSAGTAVDPELIPQLRLTPQTTLSAWNHALAPSV